jgi:hypothetical protein
MDQCNDSRLRFAIARRQNNDSRAERRNWLSLDVFLASKPSVKLRRNWNKLGVPAKACIVSGLHQFDEGFTRSHVDLEFAAAQLFPKMLAQRLLVDLELIGDFGLGDANGRSVLDERALFGGRLIFGSYFPVPTQLRDARARGGKIGEDRRSVKVRMGLPPAATEGGHFFLQRNCRKKPC